MRIFIILLIISNLLYWGLNYFIPELVKPSTTSLDSKVNSTKILVLLSEVERSELISEAVGKNLDTKDDDLRQKVTCLKVTGDWNSDRFDIVKNSLQQLEKSFITEGKARRKKVNYWVVIPPLSSKKQAIEVKRNIQSAKIVDIFIIKSGARENALSLGLYSTVEGAERRARFVNDKKLGLPKAGIEELTLYVDRYWIKIAPFDDDLEAITGLIGSGVIDTEIEQCEIEQ